MEIIILTLIGGVTVLFLIQYLVKTFKHGELCQTCHLGKTGCGSRKTTCKEE